jgi:hypothetical protein
MATLLPLLLLLLLLLLLSLPPSAVAFLDRTRGLHLFTLPETRSALHHAATALHGNSRWRMLEQRNGHYPEVHDAHEFVGATTLGFVSFNVTAIVKSTTVQTDDYLDLLLAAELRCSPRAVPVQHQGQGHVQLAVSFPEGSPPDQAALAHLLDRLAHPEAVLSFGVDTLLTHPSLGASGSCLAHVPGRDPFFRVLALGTQQGSSSSSLTLDLSPTSPQEAFRFLAFSLQHTPDAEGEVARRRALGLWPGRQLPVAYSDTIASFGVNWNGNAQAPGAKVAKIPLFAAQPNALYCSNCYFYMGATLNINVQVCAIVGGATTKYYDANLPTAVMSTGYYYSSGSSGPGAASSDAEARAKTDCQALGTPSGLFNVGLSAEAYFSGSAAFNFAIASDGITASQPLAFPEGCTAPSKRCTPTQLPSVTPFEISTITVAVAGLPITIDPKIILSGSALGTLNMPALRLQFGASASVSLKLGGKVSFTGLPNTGRPTLTPIPYFDFTASFSQQPFQLSGFTAAAGSLDVTIVPVISVLIWKILPFTIQPMYTMVQTLAVGGARQLGLRGEGEQEGNLTSTAAAHTQRVLDACATGQVSSSATAQGSLGVVLDAVSAFNMVKSITGLDAGAVPGLSNFDIQVIPRYTLVNPDSTTFSVAGAVPAAATACVAVGSAISLGGTIGGGGGGDGSNAVLSGNTLIGVAAGASVGGLLLLGALYYYCFARRKAAASRATAASVVSSKGPTDDASEVSSQNPMAASVLFSSEGAAEASSVGSSQYPMAASMAPSALPEAASEAFSTSYPTAATYPPAASVALSADPPAPSYMALSAYPAAASAALAAASSRAAEAEAALPWGWSVQGPEPGSDEVWCVPGRATLLCSASGSLLLTPSHPSYPLSPMQV